MDNNRAYELNAQPGSVRRQLVEEGRPVKLERLGEVPLPVYPTLSHSGEYAAWQEWPNYGGRNSPDVELVVARVDAVGDGAPDVHPAGKLGGHAPSWPCWHPDSNTLLYSVRTPTRGPGRTFKLLSWDVAGSNGDPQLVRTIAAEKLERILAVSGGSVACLLNFGLYGHSVESSLGRSARKTVAIYSNLGGHWQYVLDGPSLLDAGHEGFLTPLQAQSWDFTAAADADGRTPLLAFCASASDVPHYWIDTDIYLQRQGQSHKLLRTRGGRDVSPRFSADGKYLAVGSKPHIGSGSWEYDRLHVYHTGGNAADPWFVTIDRLEGTEQNRAAFFPRHWHFISDKHLLFTTRGGEPATSRVHLIDVEDYQHRHAFGACVSPACEVLAESQDEIEQVSARSPNASKVSVLIRKGSFLSPPELYIGEFTSGLGGAATGQPDQNNRAWSPCSGAQGRRNSLPRDRKVIVERSKFPAASGREVETFVSFPAELNETNQRWPVVQLLHGGPHLAWSARFDRRLNGQSLAAKGYIVVQTNFHGSLGHRDGEAFTRSLLEHWGELPAEDIRLTTEQVIREYPVDDKRIALIGGSYGAYLGAWVLAQKRTGFRFRAGVLHAGPYDLSTLYAKDVYWIREHQFKAAPWDGDMGKTLSEMSPLRRGSFYRAPTLITHGESDQKIPVANSVMLHRMLVDRQVASRLTVYPGMAHVISSHHIGYWWMQAIAWLTEHGAGPGPS